MSDALLPALRLIKRGISVLAIFFLCLVQAAWTQPGPAYDPLRIDSVKSKPPVDLTIRDEKRSREIPIRVYLPVDTEKPAPVILFSHGLGGSRMNNPYLGEHWSARGYAVIFLQHPGSDQSVWEDTPREQRKKAMKSAASLKNYLLRAQDVTAVLDRLYADKRKRDPVALALDFSRIGMSGHSFGAGTTQAVAGQNFPWYGTSLRDSRVKAAVAFSPSGPRRGNPADAFGAVKIPWMLMTGTKDDSIIVGTKAEDRREVFRNLPPGNKYELVLFNAEHSAFSDRALPGDKEARNPNHHRAVLALSTAFFDLYLNGDSAARHWLDGAGPHTVLEPEDSWQRK